MNYYLAIDIGASSGRHMLFHLENGKLVLEEIHRFENGMKEMDGHLCWDTKSLFAEIITGMKKCKEMNKIPVSVGIDTWGVDFVLLDDQNQLVGNAVGYRDHRTDGVDLELYKVIPEKDLYARTGIQKAIFNTIYQLYALKLQNPEQLQAAKTFLFMPDYLNFLLCGKKTCEYTIASTSQMLNPTKKDWDIDLLNSLGLPTAILPEISTPGTRLGSLTDEVAKAVGYQTEVVLPPCHDTGSAVMAVPTSSETVYISSGTWSLMGIERMEADLSEKAYQENFTNEGGYDYRFRFLKNIMGLWMIQSVRNEWIKAGTKYSFGEICDMAEEAKIDSLVDCNDNRFLSPKSMNEEIKAACKESNQQVPETPGEMARIIYRSLARCYSDTIRGIESIVGKTYDHINIVGGGANAAYLNILTAKTTGKTVYAGPFEATAIGNACCQMLSAGEFKNLTEARACVFKSFDVETFEA